MAESTRSVAIEPNLGWNGGESFRAAFWTRQGSTSARRLWMAELWGGLTVPRLKFRNQQKRFQSYLMGVTLVIGGVRRFEKAGIPPLALFPEANIRS